MEEGTSRVLRGTSARSVRGGLARFVAAILMPPEVLGRRARADHHREGSRGILSPLPRSLRRKLDALLRCGERRRRHNLTPYPLSWARRRRTRRTNWEARDGIRCGVDYVRARDVWRLLQVCRADSGQQAESYWDGMVC